MRVDSSIAPLFLILGTSSVSDAFQLFSGKIPSTTTNTYVNRRQLISTLVPSTSAAVALILAPQLSWADEAAVAEPAEVLATGDIKKLFNEGRAREMQGDIAAAQRLYGKVTKLAPKVSASFM